jgi:hypothetical protein
MPGDRALAAVSCAARTHSDQWRLSGGPYLWTIHAYFSWGQEGPDFTDFSGWDAS